MNREQFTQANIKDIRGRFPATGLTKRQRRLKHGVTVYYVSAFMHGDRDGSAYITKHFVTGKPYYNKVGLFVPDSRYDDGRFSLGDCHADGPQTYNLHRLFFSRKKAEAYANLVNSGCDVRSMFGIKPRFTEYPFDTFLNDLTDDYDWQWLEDELQR